MAEDGPVHPEYLWIVITSGISCALLAVSIGSNDVANAFSTSVGSGALSLKWAISIAFIFEIIGSIFLGGTVTDSIRTRVLNFEAFSDCPFELALGMLCSSLGATAWLMFSTYFGIPVSTTHSIIGALFGFGVASGRFTGVRWLQLLYIVVSWLAVPLLAIVVSGAIYIIIQEIILKRDNSFEIMKYCHWLFFAIFYIPVSIFIAFENSVLRSAKGVVPDHYREWFNASKFNKFLSVLIVLSSLVVLSCLVTYSLSYVRMRSGWSYLESLRNMDPLLTNPIPTRKQSIFKPKNAVKRFQRRYKSRRRKEHSYESERDHSKHSNPSNSQDNSDFQVLSKSSGSVTDKKLNQGDSEVQITINPKNSMDMNIGDDRVEIMEVTKSSFSRSVIDTLLTSVGFPRAAKNAQQQSVFISSDNTCVGNEDMSLHKDMDHSGSYFSRFMSNIKSSYKSASNYKNSFLGKSTPSSNTSFFGSKQYGSTKSRSIDRSHDPDDYYPYKGYKVTPEQRLNADRTQSIFSTMQVVASTLSIISHSANDTANSVSPFATVYFLYLNGVKQQAVNTPWYILLSGGICMSMGLAIFGYKVIKTVGLSITKVTPSRGYTIDATSGCIVFSLSHLGIPLSSTHVTVSSILGIGLIQQLPAYRLEYKKKTSSNNSSSNFNSSSSNFNSSRTDTNTNFNTPSTKNLPELTDNVNGKSKIHFDQDDDPSLQNLDVESKLPDGALNHTSDTYKDEPLTPKFSLKTRLTFRHVNLKLYRKIFFTWIVTIFCSGIVTAIFFLLGKLIYSISRKS